MITASQLQQYLDAYDDLASTVTLTMQQQQKLNNLRMLARANGIADLTPQIQALMNGAPVVNANTPTSFEKLVLVLRGEADSSLLVSSTSSQLSSVVGTDSGTNAEQWLRQLLGQVQSQLGGDFGLSRSGSSLNLTLRGPLTMKYSVFMALMSAEVIAKHAYLDRQHITGDVTIPLNDASLEKMVERAKSLVVVRQFLLELGFQVEMGSKTCEQSLSQNSAFASRDNMTLITNYNMSLDVANALASTGAARIVLPLTLKITTRDDNLMLLLESYYSHDLVNLRSRDGTQKTFILETRGKGSLHESVLNMDQLATLRDFFDRLDYFSKYYNKHAAALTEADINKATLDIYTQVNRQKEGLLNLSNPFEVGSHYQYVDSFNRLASVHAFEQSIETLCKSRLIPSPHLYMNDTPFIKRINQIQADIFQGEEFQMWPTFRESYNYTPNSSLPRSPLPLYYYAQAIARATLGQPAKIGSTSNEHNLGVEWLNKTVNRSTYGSAANQHYYDFYTENNAFYLLDSLVSRIKMCLDHPQCTEQHIFDMLKLIGVSEGSIERLQSNVGGERHFNRFQIKLFLIPLVLNGLCRNELLADVQTLANNYNPWVKVTNPNSTSYARTTTAWYEGMRDWKNTEIQGIRWSFGGPESTSKQRNYSDTTQRNTLFAGGTQADQTRQQQTRSSVSYGSSS